MGNNPWFLPYLPKLLIPPVHFGWKPSPSIQRNSSEMLSLYFVSKQSSPMITVLLLSCLSGSSILSSTRQEIGKYQQWILSRSYLLYPLRLKSNLTYFVSDNDLVILQSIKFSNFLITKLNNCLLSYDLESIVKRPQVFSVSPNLLLFWSHLLSLHCWFSCWSDELITGV